MRSGGSRGSLAPMKERPFWQELLKAAADGAARVFVGLLATAVIGAAIGAAVGWRYGGGVLAAAGAVLGAFAGMALWLVGYYAMNTL